jgi:hypothetical protein
MGCESVDWMVVAQNKALENTVMNLQVPSEAVNFLTS